MLLTEDLHIGYHEGFSCEDGSFPVGSPLRHFQCRVCLLMLAGDYPALAKMTGFTHAGHFHCHWCMQRSQKNPSTNRHMCGDFRRWLPSNSVQRAAGGNFDEPETNPPPPLREHRRTAALGVRARNWIGRAADHPSKTAGICNWCPLVEAPKFDVVWDTAPDMMHCVKYYSAHVLPAMMGSLSLARPTLWDLKIPQQMVRRMTPRELNAEKQRRVVENERRWELHKKARKVPILSIVRNYCV